MVNEKAAQNDQELAYWLTYVTIKAMALESLEWGILRPAQIVDAATEAIESATREHYERQDRANSGH